MLGNAYAWYAFGMDALFRGMELLRSQPGLMARIAKELGVTRAAVTKWRRIPAERVLAVEEITGVARHLLRPDLYPPPWRRPRRRGSKPHSASRVGV